MSFAAGFAKGFANTFVSNLKDRRERIQDLVDQGIASAKAVAPRYAQATAEYKNILEIGDIMKTRYNVSDEEFVALAQGTDITKLYQNIINEDAARTSAGRSGVSKQDFINVVDMPEAVLPENTTREQAIAQIMGLQSVLLEKEDDPKSEAAKTRTGAASLGEYLGYNPNLSAEKQLETMKIMGYDVSDLEYFQATQGTKQKVIPGVTRTRDVVFDDIDYDKNSYDGTQRKFNSMIATRLAGADISKPDIWNTTTGIPADDKTVMRDSALEASMSMAKLELEIINSGAGLGLIGPAARRNLLEGIFSQIDGGTAGVQEIQTLMTNVENGNAIAAINAIYNEKGRFTAEDYQSIINGVVPETSPVVTSSQQPSVEEQTETALTDDDMGLPTGPVTLDQQPDVAAVAPTAPVVDDTEVEDLKKKIEAEDDPVIKNALQNELNQMIAEAEDKPTLVEALAKRPGIRTSPYDTLMDIEGIVTGKTPSEKFVTPDEDNPMLKIIESSIEALQAPAPEIPAISSARDVARRNLDNKERMRGAMESVTKDQWDEMSRDERRDAGLPVRPLDMWFAGSDAFKEEPKEEEPSAPEKVKNTVDFLEGYNENIVTFLRGDGLTGEEDEEEFKYALAAWFDENSNRLDIPAMTSGADLDTLAKLYKTLFTNLNQ